MRKLWRHRWFILAVSVSVFFALIGSKVVAAGTDSQLLTILGKGLEGFEIFLAWLLEVWGTL